MNPRPKQCQGNANKNLGNVGINKNAKKHGVIVLPGDEYDCCTVRRTRGGERLREMSSSPLSRPTVPPLSSNCNYCGGPIKWHFHEEYAGWRSTDPETGEEHECDPSSMLTTVDMAHCKRCGKLVRWGPPPELEDAARAYEIHIYPHIEHRCHQSKSA